MMERNYVLSITDNISQAWSKINGVKGSIWAGIFFMLLITIAFLFIEHLVGLTFPILSSVIYVISRVVQFLLQMGLFLIGIKWALGLPVSYQMIFHTFEWRFAAKIIGAYFIVFILLLPFAILASLPLWGEGFLILLLFSILALIGVIGFIYLLVRLSMTQAFVLDQKINPWKATKLSYQVTRSNFWALIGIFILEILIILVSTIPLGLGLIWTLPFAFVLYGVVYRNLRINSHQGSGSL